MKRVIAFLTFAVLTAGGATVLYCQDLARERRDADAHAQTALRQIDAVLNEARAAAETARESLGDGCTIAVTRKLSMLAAVSPHLRTVSLIKDGTVYCSSLFGPDDRPAELGRFYQGELALLPSNGVTPGQPLLIYLANYPLGSVGIGIHVSPITGILTLLGPQRGFRLRVGDAWLAGDGQVSVAPSGAALNARSSTAFHFSVLYPAAFLGAADFWRQSETSLLLLALFSGCSCLLVYRFVGSIGSPHEYLKKAIKNKEIVPFYQPIIATDTQTLSGIEVLARWRHPKIGPMAPDIFIPLAEQSGLIMPLTWGLMEHVMHDLAPYQCLLPDNLRININISATHCLHPEFVADCRRFLAAFVNRPIRLMLEITERERLPLTPETLAFFNKLYLAGIGTALDDFGTGYCNLDYLRKLKVNQLKIDKSFISMINEEPESMLLVDCVIDMAKKLKLQTVAEGVETEYQQRYLRQKNIDFMQGYLFAPPLPKARFIDEWLLNKPAASR